MNLNNKEMDAYHMDRHTEYVLKKGKSKIVPVRS
jgi:hypothetical protein